LRETYGVFAIGIPNGFELLNNLLYINRK